MTIIRRVFVASVLITTFISAWAEDSITEHKEKVITKLDKLKAIDTSRDDAGKGEIVDEKEDSDGAGPDNLKSGKSISTEVEEKGDVEEKMEEIIEDAKEEEKEGGPEVGEASYNTQDCEKLNDQLQSENNASLVSRKSIKKDLDGCEKIIK